MIAAKVARGAMFLVAARLMTRGLDLLAMLIVARILTPADFGLVALASTLLLVLAAATDVTVASAIIQMEDAPSSAYDTAFTLNLARGVLLALLLVALAEPFAALYHEPRLAPLVVALTLYPLARGLISPRLAARMRDLSFREQMTVEVLGRATAFVASVAVALLTRSYWALIAGMVGAQIISSVVSYVVAPYRPRLGLGHARRIFAFSGWVTLSNAVNQINYQMDGFLIGYRLGTATLGQYNVGSQLASLPTQAPVQPMMQALFAGFARVAADPQRLRVAYLTSQRALMALALPIGFAVSALAYPIVDLVLGPQWQISAFVIAILAPVFAVQMLTGPAQAATMAAGETRALLERDLIGFAIRVPLIVAGLLLYGLVGVVLARIVSGLASIWMNLAIMRRIAAVSIAEQVYAPWRSLVSAGLMSALMWIAVPALYPAGDVFEQAAAIVAAAAAGGLVYVATHTALWLCVGRPDGPERQIAAALRSVFGRTRANG